MATSSFMKFGVVIFPTDKAIQPVELAREVEARGFESLWFPEHSHIPTSRQTPWPGGSELPEHYWRIHDQFVALGAAAAVTEDLRLGTGITLVAQRDAIWLAKQVASLDVISNGRLLFGVGYGWNREEMAHHGVDFTSRRELVREKLLAMKKIWMEDQPSFSGELVGFEPMWSWPKPAQKPHPPIILGGGASPKTFAAIVELADGWIPIMGRDQIIAPIAQLQAQARDAGREPIEISVFQAPPDRKALEELGRAGASRAIFGLPPEPAETVLPMLDEYARIAANFDS